MQIQNNSKLWFCLWQVILSTNVKFLSECTVNPLLSPLGAYLFQAHLRRGNGAYFSLEKTMVSVLHKELEYKVENKKVGGHATEDQNQIWTSSWEINHPGSVHAKFYSHGWFKIQSLIY